MGEIGFYYLKITEPFGLSVGCVLKGTEGSCLFSLKFLNMGYTIMGDKCGPRIRSLSSWNSTTACSNSVL